MARFSKDPDDLETTLPVLGDMLVCAFLIILFVFVLISIKMPFYLLSLVVLGPPTFILTKYAWRSIEKGENITKNIGNYLESFDRAQTFEKINIRFCLEKYFMVFLKTSLLFFK